MKISYNDALRVMDELFARGVRLLIFEGGEPFLWKDGKYSLDQLVQYARERFFRVGITTNGLLPLESSADIIWVSIDGLKKTHEANRGVCFDKIMHNIDSSSHPRIFANITINKLNYQEIPSLIKFLDKKVRGITIQFYYPFPNSEDLALSNSGRKVVLEKLIDLKKNGYPILDSISVLEALKDNQWRCNDWLIANAEPDGHINIGCYLKDRAEISCDQCGFA
ncbi:MAG: hypothetical protein SCK70_17750, partial [bacterium]|nr:hypothetical protein [bacterium]